MLRILLIAGLLASTAPLRAQDSPSALHDSASFAWERGDYHLSLPAMLRLLDTPGSERYLEPLALLTGELYVTTELAPDGRSVRWSGDGRYIAFETGAATTRTTHILVMHDGGTRPVARVSGYGLAFSPTAERVAYLLAPETRELAAARAELERLAAGDDERAEQRQRGEVLRVEAGVAQVRVRDLRTGREQPLTTPALATFGITYAADGQLYASAAERGTPGMNIHGLAAGAAPRAVTRGAGMKLNPTAIPGGSWLWYTTAVMRSGITSFAIVNTTTGEIRSFDGGAPAVAADGSKLAYVSHAAGGYALNVVSLQDGTSVPIKRTPAPLDNPAFSRDGRRVVFQMMPREDWELYLTGSDGSGELRLTREIQHDLLPRFLTNDRVLAVMGEARHRRSHVYDARTGERQRLFHNNTVRTVAPEYEWAVSPDGSKIVIVAERDGDTISPERGVYLVDLTRKIRVAELRERIRASLAAEQELRERGRRSFEPIAAEVRAAVQDVSVARIHDYEKTLFGFDSKYITRPGNRLAIDYLTAKLREFGYEPELQWFEPRPGIRTANVIATLRGTAHPELIYVVSSHFDSVEDGPGSDDNTSGTTALLEAARVLARRPMPATIKFAFFTGEEAGLLGSRVFVRRAVASRDRIVGALNNDMIGWANDHRLDNTIRYSNAGIRDLQHAAAFLFTSLITYDAKYYKSTDAHAYYEVYGDIVGGIGSYPILGNPHYHQSHDVLETINHRLVAEVSRTTIASIMRLAASPARLAGLELVERRGQGLSARWTPAAESDVREYVVAYGPAAEPLRHSVRVTEARVQLESAAAGTVLRVKAVNARGLDGWDWAQVVVGKE